MTVKLKICCIKSIEEAQLAVTHGASAIGLVGPMPSGPGIIDNNTIREIAHYASEHVETFLLSSETKAKKIVEHYDCTRTSAIQLVDFVNFEELKIVKENLRGIRIIQVIHVNDHSAVSEAMEVMPFVDTLLLDSGQPHAEQRTLGGTGQTHNWNISRQIVAQSSVPVFLAGGINQTNVLDAIRIVRPHGIDLCSGVRNNDNLDGQLLKSFTSVMNGKHQLLS